MEISFKYNIDRKSTDYLMFFLKAWLLCGDAFQKNTTTTVGFEPRTSFARL